MHKALPYIFLLVLAGCLLFMGYYMNDLAKLGNKDSIHQVQE